MATQKPQGKFKNLRKEHGGPKNATPAGSPGPQGPQVTQKQAPNSKLTSNSAGPYNCAELTAVLQTLQQLIKCKGCEAPMQSVRTCLNGHAVCWKCKTRCAGYCPLCHTAVPNNKPELLNEIVQRLPRYCGFTERGCRELVLPQDNQHETYCRYRDTFCRIRGCGWRGPAKDLLQHLERFHGKEVIRTASQSSILMSFNTNTDREGLAVIVAFNNIFWQHNRVRQNRLMQFYQYVPMEKPRSTFSVLVKFHTPEMSFGKTTPVHTDVFDPKQLFYDRETFSLPKKVADSFSKFHSGVHYSVNIIKIDL